MRKQTLRFEVRSRKHSGKTPFAYCMFFPLAARVAPQQPSALRTGGARTWSKTKAWSGALNAREVRSFGSKDLIRWSEIAQRTNRAAQCPAAYLPVVGRRLCSTVPGAGGGHPSFPKDYRLGVDPYAVTYLQARLFPASGAGCRCGVAGNLAREANDQRSKTHREGSCPARGLGSGEM
jgi:hypothetical protein